MIGAATGVWSAMPPSSEIPSSADMAIDQALDAQQLQEKYDVLAADGEWGEHPVFRMPTWRAEVACQKTLLGYWAWVVAQFERADDGESEPEVRADAEKEEVTELEAADPGNQGS